MTIDGVEQTTSQALDGFLSHSFSAQLHSILSAQPLNHVWAILTWEVDKVKNGLEARWYTIKDQFPSTIVAKQLAEKYGEDIPVTIFLCEKEWRIFEFFIVDELHSDIAQKEWWGILHLAYKFSPESRDNIVLLIKHLFYNWFTNTAAGMNPIQNNGVGATTLYFVHEFQGTPVKIEIIVDGLHQDILDLANSSLDEGMYDEIVNDVFFTKWHRIIENDIEVATMIGKEAWLTDLYPSNYSHYISIMFSWISLMEPQVWLKLGTRLVELCQRMSYTLQQNQSNPKVALALFQRMQTTLAGNNTDKATRDEHMKALFPMMCSIIGDNPNMAPHKQNIALLLEDNL